MSDVFQYISLSDRQASISMTKSVEAMLVMDIDQSVKHSFKSVMKLASKGDGVNAMIDEEVGFHLLIPTQGKEEGDTE